MIENDRNLSAEIDSLNDKVFRNKFVEWIVLPDYLQMKQDDPEKYNHLLLVNNSKRSPEIINFLTESRLAVKKFMLEDNHHSALETLSEYFGQAHEKFQEDDRVCVLRFLYNRGAYILEHRATYGDLSKKPLGDPERTDCFVKAATMYIKSDLLLGCVTDYAGRVFECLNGAREPYVDFAIMAIKKLFGNSIMDIIGPNDPAGLVVAKDLKNRASEVLPGVPGSEGVYIIKKADLRPNDN